MRLTRYLARLVGQVVEFAVANRRPGLLLWFIALGLVLAIAATVQVVTPVVIYPFI